LAATALSVSAGSKFSRHQFFISPFTYLNAAWFI
jgi:hypothetical protein